VVVLLATASAGAAAGEEASAPPAGPRSSSLALPILFYTPETGTAFGAAVVHTRRNGEAWAEERPSTYQPMLIYTTKHQIISSLDADVYAREGRLHWMVSAGYLDYPDLFYGAGRETPESAEEDFTQEVVQIEAAAEWRFPIGLFMGVQWTYANAAIKETKPGGLLETGAATATGVVSGLGLRAALDTRDRLFWTTSGGYIEAVAEVYDDALASDYDFERYTFDLRRYVGGPARTVLAARCSAGFTNGTAPIQLLPSLGGDTTLRGLYAGRYRDRNRYTLQGEVRRAISGRWSAVTFASYGDVASRVSGFPLAHGKAGGGFGIRWGFDPDEGVNIRLDVGFADGSSATYITLGEAF
jgi:outer membrane translocation and assembly module TamA